MANENKTSEMSLPVLAAITMGIAGAIVVGLSFDLITKWPLPVAIAPYFKWDVGVGWGLVVGILTGLCIGYLTDDKSIAKS